MPNDERSWVFIKGSFAERRSMLTPPCYAETRGRLQKMKKKSSGAEPRLFHREGDQEWGAGGYGRPFPPS
jgi:hypothetical protein